VLVLPLVDVYSAERKEKAALLAELESASQVAKMIKQLETRVAEKTALLGTLESHAANDQTLPALRSRLVELARETGCGLRRLNVGTMSSRPWQEGDDAVAAAVVTSTKRPGERTGFVLQWWPVSVSITGTNSSLRSFVQRLEADGNLMHTKLFEMHPSGVGRAAVALDLELWYFNLARGG
jgi:Tfp pilus assembly protein PilO